MDGDLVHLHNIRVLNPRGKFGFSSEPLPVDLGREIAGQNHLERDRPFEIAVTRLVNDTHPASADFSQDHVRPHLARNCRRFVRRKIAGCRRMFSGMSQGARRGPALVGPAEELVARAVRFAQASQKAITCGYFVDSIATFPTRTQMLGDLFQIFHRQRAGGKLAKLCVARVLG